MITMSSSNPWLGRSRLRQYFVNGLLFQSTWFVCVLTENALLSVLSACFSILIYAIFLKAFCEQVKPQREIAWVIVLALFGIGFERLLFEMGLLEIAKYSSETLLGVNIWLVCIWLAFATTFRFCFSFLVRDIRIAPFAGFLACGSYASGASLSDEIALGGDFWLTTFYVGLLWALAMPLLCATYKLLCWPDTEKP